MADMILFHEVSKVWDDQRVINHLSLSVKSGEIYGLIGPSGVGKTTTLKMMTNQLLPTSGHIHVFGEHVSSYKQEDLMKRVGILSDNSLLYERLSLEDNLDFFATLYEANRSHVIDIIDQVGLHEARKTMYRNLSKGMKQRAVLAAAMLHSPELLILDEPTASLDPATKANVHDLLKNLNQRGATIFLTTHDMSEVETLCDTVAFMVDGSITMSNSPSAMRAAYTAPSISVVFADGTVSTYNNSYNGVTKMRKEIESKKIQSIHSSEPSLTEIFLDVTGSEIV